MRAETGRGEAEKSETLSNNTRVKYAACVKSDAFLVIDLLDEETFAPETLTGEDVRELLGIPRDSRFDVQG